MKATPTLGSSILGQCVFVAIGLYFADYARGSFPSEPARPWSDWLVPGALLGVCALVAVYGLVNIARCSLSAGKAAGRGTHARGSPS